MENDLSLEFGRWLTQRLKELGKTQTQLGQEIHRPSSRINELTKGKTTVRIEDIGPLALSLEVTPIEILSRIDRTVAEIEDTNKDLANHIKLVTLLSRKDLAQVNDIVRHYLCRAREATG